MPVINVRPAPWALALCFVAIAWMGPQRIARASDNEGLPSLGRDEGSEPSNDGFYDRFIQDRLYLKPAVSYLDFSALKSSELTLSGVEFPASLAVDNGPIAGAKATIANQAIATIGIGYNIPGTGRHLSLETIIGKPIDIDFVSQPGTLRDRSLAPTADLANLVTGDSGLEQALGQTLGDLGSAVNSATGLLDTGIPPLGQELGSVKSLPIMMTLTYHPFPDAFVRPYVGAGGVYLYNYDAEISNDVLTEVSDPGFDVSSTPGYILQAGVDVGSPQGGFFGFVDARYIGGATVKGSLSDVNVRLNNAALADTLGLLGYGEDIAVGDADIELEINAMIYSAGIGYRF